MKLIRRTVAVAIAAVLGVGLMTAIGAPTVAAPRPAPLRAPVITGPVRASLIGGNTVGDQVRQATPSSDGYRHIDVAKLYTLLTQLHVNTYVFQIWDEPTDWADLHTFLAYLQQVGDNSIQVWPYVVPPSECTAGGRCSQPDQKDYVKWASDIGALSVTYPAVTEWAIDDFGLGDNIKTFTPQVMSNMVTASHSTPGSTLPPPYSTTYYTGQNSAVDDTFLSTYSQTNNINPNSPCVRTGCFSGVLLPFQGRFNDTQDTSTLTKELTDVINHTSKYGYKAFLMTYTGREVGPFITATPAYLNSIYNLAQPFLDNGSLQGLISYGTPMTGLTDATSIPQISAQDKARDGVGRLSLSVPGNTSQSGSTASATQTVAVTPGLNSYTLTFSDTDQYARTTATANFFTKRVLVAGKVVWQSDVSDGNQDQWATHTVDVTSLVAGKAQVDVQLQLSEVNAATFGVDVGFDDVSATGLSIHNGGFEASSDWVLSDNGRSALAADDIWSANLPLKLFQTVSAKYAALAGDSPGSVTTEQTPPPLNRRAMYGAGRLSLSVGNNTSTQAGQCASATQQVNVQPGLPHYEISFYQYDQWAGLAPSGYQVKRLVVNGANVYNEDVSDPYNNQWINGNDLIGPIDVTSQVQNRATATISFQLCELRAVGDFPVDFGIDNVTAVGLDIANPGFDEFGGWTLTSQGNVKAAIDVSRAATSSGDTAVVQLPSGVSAQYQVRTDGWVWGSSQSAPNGPYGPWTRIGTGAGSLVGHPRAALVNDKVVVYARTSTGELDGTTQSGAGETFGAWTAIGAGQPTVASDPAVVVMDSGVLAVYAVGSDHNVWGTDQTVAGGAFIPWSEISSSGSSALSAPSATVLDGKIAIYARSTNGIIEGVEQSAPGAPFGAWAALTGVSPAMQGSPTVVGTDTGILAVYSTGSDGRVWGTDQSQPNGNFVPWTQIGSVSNASSSPHAVVVDGKIAIFARTASNSMIETSQPSIGATFNDWAAAGTSQPNLVGDPSVEVTASAPLVVYSPASDGNVWSSTQQGLNASFGPWGAVGS